MKKLTIILSAVVAVALLATLAIPQAEYRRGPRRSMSIQVIAVDAPVGMRTGGPPLRYICNGTQAAGGDQVQLQAAIDYAESQGGATVQLSPGTFYVAKPAAAVDVVFEADVVDGSAEATLLDDTTALNVTTGSFSDIVVGQIYRVSGGEDSGNDSVEDGGRDICLTIEKKTGLGTVVKGTWDDSENLLTSTGTFASAVIDDWLYISGGTNVTVGWHQITTVVDDDNVTIVATEIDDGAGDLATGDIESSEALLSGEDFIEDFGVVAGGNGDQPTFVRMIGAIELKAAVYVVGAGTEATRIELADDQNCSIAVFDGAAKIIGLGMSHMLLRGNRHVQGDNSTYTFHPECNGILVNDNGWDAFFSEIALEAFKGDGWWILNPWGSQIYGGGWTEFCNGSGISYGDGGNGQLTDHKIADVAEATVRDTDASNRLVGDGNTFSAAGIRLMETSVSTFKPSIVRAKNGWGVWLRSAHGNRFSGAYFSGSTGPGGILLQQSTNCVITGCLFENTATGAIGINAAARNVIVGNRFFSVDFPIECGSGTLFYGEISNNLGAFVSHDAPSVTRVPPDVHTIELLNTRGSAVLQKSWVKRNTSSGTITIVDGSESAKTPLGFLPLGINNAVAGWVQTEGYSPYAGFDNSANHAAISIGDPLCLTAATDGFLEKAADSGDWVVAICEEAYDPPGGGGTTPTHKAIYILPPGERYAIP